MDLLHTGKPLELSVAQLLLLLEGCCLKHEVLLLGCIHLLQVLGCRAGLSVERLLDLSASYSEQNWIHVLR